MKALSEGLSSRIVLRRTNVYEHTVLLEGIDSTFERAGKYVFFQASWSLRNSFQDRSIKYVHAAVYKAWCRITAFLTKANHSILRAELNATVPRGIWHSSNRHTNQTAMYMMKTDELGKVDFQKRVAIHYQEIGILLDMAPCQLQRSCRSQRMRLRGILNRDVPFPPIAEFFFNLVGKMTRAHHDAANTL